MVLKLLTFAINATLAYTTKMHCNKHLHLTCLKEFNRRKNNNNFIMQSISKSAIRRTTLPHLCLRCILFSVFCIFFKTTHFHSLDANFHSQFVIKRALEMFNHKNHSLSSGCATTPWKKKWEMMIWKSIGCTAIFISICLNLSYNTKGKSKWQTILPRFFFFLLLSHK